MRLSIIAVTAVAALGLAGAVQAQGNSGKGAGHGRGHAAQSGSSSHGQTVSAAARDNHGRTVSAAAHARNQARKDNKDKSGAHGCDADHDRQRGAADVLGRNTHASARGVERGSRSTGRAEAGHDDRDHCDDAGKANGRKARNR